METEDQQRYRFQVELEFVQCLANPNYLNFLAQRGYFKEKNFINYLKYLLYWKEPDYSRFLKYPQCLYLLELLQYEQFRKEIANAQKEQNYCKQRLRDINSCRPNNSGQLLVMSINFCLPPFKPRISCDKVCADGYEVENLVRKTGLFMSNSGFMVERFIKPPVCVTVEFPCNVDLQSVVINPIVGGQKSCGFEILTQSSFNRGCWLMDTDKCPDLKVSSSSDTFYPIGKIYTDEPKMIRFVNRSNRQRMNQSQISVNMNNCIEGDLRHHRVATLRSVSHVMIRITRTLAGAIPGMKSLEIWGQPALCTPRQLTNLIQQINYNIININPHPAVSVHDNTSESSPCKADIDTAQKASLPNDVEIPPEFIDPLTMEIMALPSVLPSGHTIDQCTLDKYIEYEAHWGRSPSDPFTGVIFTDSHKPLLNAGLKSRIDQFLLTNSDKDSLKHVGRTLGHNNDDTFTSVGKNLGGTSSIAKIPIPSYSSSTQGAQMEHKDTGIRCNVSKESTITPLKRSHTDIIDLTDEDQTEHKPTAAKVQKVEFKSNAKGTPSHSTKLSDSLDQALSSSLNYLPTYSKFVKPAKDLSKLCAQCDSEPKPNGKYKITCGHIICRDCLVGRKSGKCKICKIDFLSKDVQKCH
ncbi:unnamed protein product [Owenia fusiformis]|uniref:Uncharacterized protein n=1 Tax=Owenia fusiformis TaxID=6347 RepID=A0A8S4NR32_OWEFU|nr:unnamed protein product [Owenia fusiformis]